MTRSSRWLLALSGCASVYRAAQKLDDGPFDERVLRALDATAQSTSLDEIPASGPALIVANHPHGLADGLALLSLVRRARPDVRLLANHLLAEIPELADLCFFVDPFGGPAAASQSVAGLRAAWRWLRHGHVLVMFPSGEVAHRPAADGSYLESPWRDTGDRLARATGAPIVSAFIEGRNSAWFYAAGRVHPFLRTALLVRELLNKRGSPIHVRFSPDAIVREVDALPADACLVSDGRFQVFCARAHAIPAALQEIGRLRARTYRAVGEGTGRPIDLDEFDEHYQHVFLWDRAARRIAGAYRLGEVDRIVAERGVGGLYTRTLFRYDARLLGRCGPALELGRSFVCREYQRSYGALLMLWKGIGRFVARHPQHRVLFGPVSISPRYTEPSRQMLMAFLRRHHLNTDVARLAEAIHPPQENTSSHLQSSVPHSIEEVGRLVAAAEPDGKGVPILLRQYLKLNARLIGFNVDPDFGDALDALMMVDLTSVDPSVLARYLGRDATEHFLARHSFRPAAA